MLQCHDNPDADAISCAFAIKTFLACYGKDAVIFYSGAAKITKSNILMMTEALGIKAEYIRRPSPEVLCDMLVCVDCQYGEGNVTKFNAKAVTVIDHHLQGSNAHDTGVIKPEYGSCATVVWELLSREGFDFNKHKMVSTALYYGLYTDTAGFTELRHPLDMDMRDTLYYDKHLFKKLKHCNLTFDELEIAGVALLRNFKDYNKRYAIFKAEPCDPNILGIIADMAMQVDKVDICVVYSLHDGIARLSFRSCSREVMAREYAEFLTEGVGSGGGHKDKAGGHIKTDELDKLEINIGDYIINKTAEYFDSFDCIDSAAYEPDISGMAVYRRLPVPRGYVISTDVFPEGTPMTIRAISNESNITASADIYLMIGIKGEVYPSTAEKFHASYNATAEHFKSDYLYNPTAKNIITGEIKQLLPFLHICVPNGERRILAKPLARNTKVFTELDTEGYIYGHKGDYLAVDSKNPQEIYIVPGDVFAKTYKKVES